MRDYYLLVDGQQTGPYTAEQLHQLVASEQLTVESLAWYEGLADWTPLGTILEEVMPAVEAPVAPGPAGRGIGARTFTPAAPMAPMPYSGVLQTNVKQGALLGGLVCFLLGMGCMYLSLFTFFLYGPFFCAAFILSIVAMAQRRVAGGVILLLAILIVPTIFGLFLFTKRASSALASLAPPASVQRGPVNITDPPAAAPTITTPGDSSTSPIPTGVTNANPATLPPASVEPPPPSKHPALDAKMGFRTYKLGTPLSQFDPNAIEAGMAMIKTDMKPYFVKEFDKTLGTAEIDSIQLDFVQDILQSVTVSVKGKQSSLALKDALIAAYGQPDESSTLMIESDTWNGDDCVLNYTTAVLGDDSSADFSSKSVDAKIKGITEQKAQEGAAAGAKGL